MKKCIHIEYKANDKIKELLLSPKPITRYRIHDKNSNKVTKFGPMSATLREYLTERGFKLEPKEKLYHNKVNTIMSIEVDDKNNQRK